MSLKICVSWEVRTTPFRATRWGASPVIFSPSNRTSPPVGLRNPVISLNRVLFPAPFGPIMLRISPRLTLKLTWSTAVRPPNRFVSARVSSTTVPSRLTPRRRDPPSQPRRSHPQAQQPIGQPEHGEDHDHGVDQRLVLAQPRQQLEAQEEHERAGHRAEHIREPAEKAVEHEEDRIRHREARGIDALLRGREERPADPGEAGADGEGRQAILGHIDADAGGERLVLAEGSEEHTSELQSPCNLVCRLLLEKKNSCHLESCR